MAVDDYVESDGKTVQIYVLANDSGDFDSSTLSITEEPTQGKATVIATGSPKIKYSGSGNGTDTFQYSVCNAGGACATATVTINFAVATTTSSTSTTVVETTASPTTQPPPTQPPVTTVPATTAPLPTTTAVEAQPPTTSSPPPSLTTTTPTTSSPADPLAISATPDLVEAAGTTIGERRRLDLAEDVRFLGRGGAEAPGGAGGDGVGNRRILAGGASEERFGFVARLLVGCPPER